MKRVVSLYMLLLIVAVSAVVACNQPQRKKTDEANTASQSTASHDTATAHSAGSSVIAPVVTSYLALKNALSADDGNAAANAGKQLVDAIPAIDMKAVPSGKHQDYMDIMDDVKVNGTHIGENAGKIDHQREHFAALSKDVEDLVAMFGAPQKLYQDYCPMYDSGKGATWLSETKEIRNPFFGSKMSSCGSVKKEY
ncbi:MAG: DUF3347 domain-containing protein [Filimonas sp.]|nr:DUF3347 domain-containing protein [Filimonas sp.]